MRLRVPPRLTAGMASHKRQTLVGCLVDAAAWKALILLSLNTIWYCGQKNMTRLDTSEHSRKRVRLYRKSARHRRPSTPS